MRLLSTGMVTEPALLNLLLSGRLLCLVVGGRPDQGTVIADASVGDLRFLWNWKNRRSLCRRPPRESKTDRRGLAIVSSAWWTSNPRKTLRNCHWLRWVPCKTSSTSSKVPIF